MVIWGLFHGLVVLPSLLAALPSSFLKFNCYQMLSHRVLKSNNNNENTAKYINSSISNKKPVSLNFQEELVNSQLLKETNAELFTE